MGKNVLAIFLTRLARNPSGHEPLPPPRPVQQPLGRRAENARAHPRHNMIQRVPPATWNPARDRHQQCSAPDAADRGNRAIGPQFIFPSRSVRPVRHENQRTEIFRRQPVRREKLLGGLPLQRRKAQGPPAIRPQQQPDNALTQPALSVIEQDGPRRVGVLVRRHRNTIFTECRARNHAAVAAPGEAIAVIYFARVAAPRPQAIQPVA